MFKRWYKKWQRRLLCDHHWHNVGTSIGRETGRLYTMQYCPLCDKKRNKLTEDLENEKAIKRIKRMYKD